MNYIIFDLEATCWGQNEVVPGDSEIIEIGAIMLDQHCQQIDYLEQFVRPVQNPVLSDFCTELTSIEQNDLMDAPEFSEAILIFKEWIGNEDHVLISWGDWDKQQLKRECGKYGFSDEWLKNHINLKNQYHLLRSPRKILGFKTAMKREGLQIEGRHHRGIDDAYNIGKIFKKYFEFWKLG